MSYRPDKLVIDTHTHTHTHRPTDAGDDNTRRPKLASGKNAIFNLVLLIGNFRSSDNTLRWMPQNLADGQQAIILANVDSKITSDECHNTLLMVNKPLS